MQKIEGLMLPARAVPPRDRCRNRRREQPRGAHTAVYILAAVIFAGLVGCQPAARAPATPTAAAAEAAAAEAAAGAAEAYPTGYDLTALPETTAQAAYPPADPGTGSGPSGVIAIENNSRITARLISITPDPERAEFTRLRVEVLTSADIPGVRNFTSARLREEIEILAETAALPDLQAGENIEAEVSYRGDEHGGIFTAREVKQQGP